MYRDKIIIFRNIEILIFKASPILHIGRWKNIILIDMLCIELHFYKTIIIDTT